MRGVAPSAVAAGVLTEQAGIASETLARFLLEVANGRTTLTPGEVVVCDEASMVSTRDLARLVLVADAADAKVVLVGDHYQLGSVDAGGLFRLLAADTKTAELTGVRRFSDHDTVDQLAMRARAARVHAGDVEAGGISVGHQTVGVGDEIVTTRNDRRLVTTTGAWVRNGDCWTVEQRTQGGAMRLRSLDSRGTVTVPGDYVQEHVGLAYAVTVHRSQGLTVD